MTANQRQEAAARFLLPFFWSLALITGALHAWAERHSMNGDGITYLEVAEAYLRGDWNTAINGMWGPLYSWLLALGIYLAQPSPYWEFPLLHLINFIVYSISLASFAFFLNEITLYQDRLRMFSDAGYMLFPKWAWIAIGYSLFIWFSIEWIGLRMVTGDACVAALVYLAAGLLIRIKREGQAAGSVLFAALGFVLGLSYLAKTAMFPLSFIFLALGMLSVGNPRKGLARSAVALACFLLVAGPFVAALSLNKGRLTFGDSGKINYAWYVGGVKARHWQGENPAHGVPKHTTRKIHDDPAVYEYDASPFKATYPPWYDPSYWFDGLKVQFDLSSQIRALKTSLKRYPEFFAGQIQTSALTGLTVGTAILYWIGWSARKTARRLDLAWQLIIPPVAAVAMYSLVHVESRYLAPFAVLFWSGLFSAILLPTSLESRRLLTGACVIMAAFVLLPVLVAASTSAYAAARDLKRGESFSAAENWQIASGLVRMGLKPGDKVAVIGWAASEAIWARRARLKIVAELVSDGWGFPDGDKFWSGGEEVRAHVYQVLSRTEAKAIVARIPDAVKLNGFPRGWRNIEDTTHSVFFLQREQSGRLG